MSSPAAYSVDVSSNSSLFTPSASPPEINESEELGTEIALGKKFPAKTATNPKLEARSEVLKEMLETEESYLRDLDALHEAFILPLQNKVAQQNEASSNVISSRHDGRRRRSTSLLAGAGSRDGSSDSGTSTRGTRGRDPLAFIKHPVIIVLFRNLQHLRKLNTRLCKKLHSVITADMVSSRSLNGTSVAVSDVFLSYAPLFKLYCEYAKGYDQAVTILREFTAESQAQKEAGQSRLKNLFRNNVSGVGNSASSSTSTDEEFNLSVFLNQAMNSKLCDGKPIQSYLILPIQRVPRYELLLRQLYKSTPDGHPDKVLTPKAIDEVHKAAAYIDLQLANMELRKRLRELEEKFQGCLALIDTVPRREELRKIFKQGLLKCVRIAKMKKEESLYFFLFDDFLVVCIEQDGDRYRMLEQIPLVECSLEDQIPRTLKGVKVKDEAAFSLMSEYGTYIVEANNVKEKQDWVKMITANIMKEKRLQGLKMFRNREALPSDLTENEDAEMKLINEVRTGIRKSEIKQLKEKLRHDLPILKDSDPLVSTGQRYLIKEGILTIILPPKSLGPGKTYLNSKQSSSKCVSNFHLLNDHLIISKKQEKGSTVPQSGSLLAAQHPPLNLNATMTKLPIPSLTGGSLASTFSAPSLASTFSAPIGVEEILEVVETIPVAQIELQEDIQDDLSLFFESKSVDDGTVRAKLKADPFSKFAFKLKSPNFTVVVVPESEIIKKDWISHIKTCMMRYKEETKADQAVDDRKCFICNSDFSIFNNKRHTCKLCGMFVCNSCSTGRRFIPNYSLVKEARVCDRCYSQPAVKSKDDFDDDVTYEFHSKPEELKEGQTVQFADDGEETFELKSSLERGISLSLSKNNTEVKDASPAKISDTIVAPDVKSPESMASDGKSRKSVYNRGILSVIQHPVWFIDGIEVPLNSTEDYLIERYGLVKEASREIRSFLKVDFKRTITFPAFSRLLLVGSPDLQTQIYLRKCESCQSAVVGSENFCGKCGLSCSGDPIAATELDNLSYRSLWLLYITESVYAASVGQLVNDIARDLVEELHLDDSDAKKKKKHIVTTKKNLIISSEHAIFFSSIAQIHTLHSELRKGLMRHVQVRRFADSSLGEYLNQLIPFFGIYEDYMLNIAHALRLFKDDAFLDYLQMKSLNPDGLENLIRYPISRLEQYGLFLESLIEVTPESNPDRSNIKLAAQKHHEKISYLRNCLATMYEGHLLKDMEAEFAEEVILTIQGRRLIRRGEVDHIKVRVQGKKKKPLGKIELILFSDCLMEATRTKDRKLEVIFTIPLFSMTPAGLAAPNLDEVEFKHEDIFKICTTDGVELWFATPSERDSWIEEINKSVDQFMNVPSSLEDQVIGTLERATSDRMKKAMTHYNSGTMRETSTLRKTSNSGGSGGSGGLTLSSKKDHRRKSATLVAILGAGAHSSSASFIGSKEIPCAQCGCGIFDCQPFCGFCGSPVLPSSGSQSTSAS